MILILAAMLGSTSIAVQVDPRVELMSIVFRLAGNPEYGQGRIASYNADIERHFGPLRDHAVVKRAIALRQSRGVSFDAPMSLAVHLKNDGTFSPRIPLDPLPDEIDHRWTSADAKAFLAELRSFAVKSNFATFLKQHADLYRTTETRLKSVIERAGLEDWCAGFFHNSPGAGFRLVPGLVNGGGSYGPHAKLPDGRSEFYSILGIWSTDSKGMPNPDDRMIPTVAHEFCHSFANPVVDSHLSELRAAGEKIFPLVANDMRRQAYSNWRTMMCESLVRACVVRYVSAHSGEKAARQEAEGNESIGFLWTGELAELLRDYEKRPEAYATLDSFAPRISAFFTEYSNKIEKVIAERKAERDRKYVELRAKGPNVNYTLPADGDRTVDPGISEIIIKFDRPMRAGNLAVMRLPGVRFPETTGQAVFDSTRTILTLPVRLESNTDYGCGLNGEGFLVMQDDKGNPLAPVEVRFHTR